MVPITDAGNWTSENGDGAWAHVPDAVTLDLEDGVRPEHKQEARTLTRETISLASRGSAEVFVRINSDNPETDLEASVWPGLTGVVLPKVEHAEEVARVSDMIGRIEGKPRYRGGLAGAYSATGVGPGRLERTGDHSRKPQSD